MERESETDGTERIASWTEVRYMERMEGEY